MSSIAPPTVPTTRDPASDAAARAKRLAQKRVLGIAAGLLLAWFAGLVVWMSCVRVYAVDEFAYAHGAWLVAQGEVPSRDFFETKFPLHLWLLAPVFRIGGDDPMLIGWLRGLMLPMIAGICLAAAACNRRLGGLTAALTALLLLSSFVFALSAVEIRPDVVALTCMMAALAVAHGPRLRDSTRGWLVGLLFAASLWGTAKAFVYCAPFALFWLQDVALLRRRGRVPTLGNPLAFVAGVLGVASLVAAYLTATGSWHDFFSNTILHNRQFVTGRDWRPAWPDLAFLLQKTAWLHAFAAIGAIRSLASVVEARERRESRLDLLLLLLVPSTLASYAIQAYPFRYSLLPFMVVHAVFAARGLHASVEWLRRTSPDTTSMQAPASRLEIARGVALSALALIMVGAFLHSSRVYLALRGLDNRAQRELLRTVDRLSRPGDAIYDNSASYVTRPHAYRMPWTDLPIRTLMRDQLAHEVPAAILESECVIALIDERFHGLPDEIKRFVAENFLPYSPEIWLWGRAYTARTGELEARFDANRSARYFVEPAGILAEGELSIDGEPVRDVVFELERGPHAIRYRGQARDFRILWLPSDGRRYAPAAPAPAGDRSALGYSL